MPTKISWADKTWNVVVGCSKASAGCLNCYAERMAIRLRGMGQEQYSSVLWAKHFEGAENKKGWNGKTVFVESAITKPLHWRSPRTIFVNSMGDTFHPSVPFEWIVRIFAVAALCPQHQFMFLTKRAGRMREFREWLGDWNAKPILHPKDTYGGDRGKYGEKLVNAMLGAIDKFNLRRRDYSTLGDVERLLSNVQLGVTVENQDNVWRIADLIRTPAAARFLSLEPLLQFIDFDQDLYDGRNWCGLIDYAFIGCESGPKARLCTLDDIRRQIALCRDSEIAVHVKQIPLNGKCNKNFNEWPPEFQVREV